MTGFKFLQKFKGWTFRRVADEIDELLGSNAYISAYPPHREQMTLPPTKSPELAILLDDTIPFDRAMEIISDMQFYRNDTKSLRDCALWLRKYHPERLQPWLEKHPPELRHWLETQ